MAYDPLRAKPYDPLKKRQDPIIANAGPTSYQKEVSAANRAPSKSEIKTAKIAAPVVNRVSIALNPNTRQINIQAPQYYLDSPEFKEQVLPYFNNLVGQSINDNDFKTLMNSDFLNQLNKQAEVIEQRSKAINEYKKLFPKAKDEDALLYLRNIAAADRTDKDSNTQIVTGFNEDGTPITQSVKTALDNFNSWDDDKKGAMIKSTLKELQDPNISESERAVNQSLMEFFKKKGAFKSDLKTQIDRGIAKGFGEFTKSFTGKVLSAPADLALLAAGKGQSFSGQVDKELQRDDRGYLEDADAIANVTGGAANIAGLATDVFVPGTIVGKGITTGAKLATNAGARALETAAPRAAIELGGRGTQAVNAIKNIPRGEQAVRGVKALAAQAPADIGFGLTQTLAQDDYDAGTDFLLNTIYNAGTLGAFKAGGKGLQAFDAAAKSDTNIIGRTNRAASQAILKGVDKFQKIPILGEKVRLASEKTLDDSAAYRRLFRNVFAYAGPGDAARQAKIDYQAAYNLSRTASMRGKKFGDNFIQSTPEFNEALQLRGSFDKNTLKQANRYVELKKNLAYSQSGNRPATEKQLESMQEELDSLVRPEYEQYQQSLNVLNDRITNLSNDIGLTDEDILKLINENEDLKNSYVYLQYENENINKANVTRGQTDARKVKGSKGLKGDRKDAKLVDPLLAAQDKVYFLANEKAKNDLIKHLVEVSERAGGLPGVRIARDAGKVRELDKLKYAAKDERTFVNNAVEVAVQDLGGDLARLADDLEDFTGEGMSIMSQRISATVDDMVDTILAEPKLQSGIEELMGGLGSGQDNATEIAALGILQRQKNHLAKGIESKLQQLPADERVQIANMFKENITSKFDGALGDTDFTAKTGSSELYKRRDEIRKLKKEIDPLSSTKGENFIPYYDNGHRGVIEVDDPDLIRYFSSSRSQAEMGWLSKLAMNSSRLFRAGTTGLNPEFALLVNPSRDFLQATVSSGSGVLAPRHLVADLMETQGITREAAQQIVDKHAQGADEFIKYGTQIETARDARSSRKAEKALEKTVRQGEAANADSGLKETWLRVKDSIPTRGTFRNLEDAISQVEIVTRKNTYSAVYSQAIKRGVSPEDAQIEALFQAANATTDFVNVGSKVENMLRTLPYLSAAINGKASFVRLAALDPVGVTMRLGYGVALPALWLTMHNLNDEERAATYDKLSEYEKNTNFIVVLGPDNVLKIPMSYELASVINPYRQMVESLSNGEDPNITEALFDAVLSSSPVDLSGFTEKDIYGERNMGLGVSRLLAAVSPQLARPIYETYSGQNMYTGGSIRPTDQELYERGQIAPGEEIRQSDRTYATKNSRILGAIADALPFGGVAQADVQNLFSSYTGRVGDFLLNGMDKLLGAPEDEQGGRDVLESAAKRFIGNTSGRINSDYYNNVDKLQGEKEILQTRLQELAEEQQFADNPGEMDVTRQRLIDEYGDKVARFADAFGEYYQRAGGFKPYQIDSLVDLLNLGPDRASFNRGSYQEGALDEVRQDAENEAVRRATDLGIQPTSSRDLFGRMFRDDSTGDTTIDYSDTSLYNNNIRSAVYGAPKQIAYEFANVVKGDKNNGIESLYDVKTSYDDRISALYDEAAKIPKADKARKTAVFDEISEVQKQYMKEFDNRIKPIIDKYGVETLSKSKVFDELSSYIIVPGEMTPYFSKKKTPYLKADAKAYLLDRYGVGKINQRNRMTDPEVQARIKEINADLSSGRIQAADFKLSDIEQQINEGKVYVDGPTMENIADMVYNLNSYKSRRKR